MLGIGGSGGLPTVLIIDDDMISREVMATVLTMAGYTIHTATQGKEALALLDAGSCSPEVILMDAQMPGLTGARLVDQLRTRTQASIYAMSASEIAEDLKKVVDGQLFKPIGPQALQELIRQHHPPPATEAAKELPVINLETLAQLRGLMPEDAVMEIYRSVVNDLDSRVAAVEEAVTAADLGAIQRIGHSIKGGCGMAGALEAARVGAQLEAGGDQLDNVPGLLEQLKDAGQNLRRMLEAGLPAADKQS